MSGGHTPGPWGYVYHRGLDQHLVGPTLENVCIVEDRHGRAEANALLIAAAPDLLAALRAAASQLDHGCRLDMYTQDLVRAAIRKAEGGAS